MQTRIRECVFEDKNHTATSIDKQCEDGFKNGYYEDKRCNTQLCRMFLSRIINDKRDS